MKRFNVVLSALSMVVAIPAANAADTGMWQLGPNVGFSVSSGGGESLTTIGLPRGGMFDVFQPGMRVGYIPAGGQYDVYADLGVSYLSDFFGESFTNLLGTFNFQYNFSPEAATTAYATAGGGIQRFSGGGSSDSNPMFGVGVGVRRQVSEGHGALRGEARFDRTVVGEGAPGVNSFGLKLGVDLWIR